MLESLDRDRVPALTLSLSPTLLGQLADPLLQRALPPPPRPAGRARREGGPPYASRAASAASPRCTSRRFYRARAVFLDEWQRELFAAFRAYQQRGLVDVITSAATHGLLPLLGASPARVRAQIESRQPSTSTSSAASVEGHLAAGVRVRAGHRRRARAGRRPLLRRRHAWRRVRHARGPSTACTRRSPASPAWPSSAATRTPRSRCGAPDGYPGDPDYRDFYRDIGFDLDPDYLRPICPAVSASRPASSTTAHGPTRRQGAVRARARPRAARGTPSTSSPRAAARSRLARSMDRPPVVVSPFDAELFGHWWFEGPLWLEHVLRRLAEAPDIRTRHAGRLPRATTRRSSGRRRRPRRGARADTSSRGSADAERLGPSPPPCAAERLRALCQSYPSAGDLTRRALTQAARELLLAQASDWPLHHARDDDVRICDAPDARSSPPLPASPHRGGAGRRQRAVSLGARGRGQMSSRRWTTAFFSDSALVGPSGCPSLNRGSPCRR